MVRYTIPYFFLFWLCVLVQGYPQTGFKFEHITVNDGLSHSDAMVVEQDKNGFIWVGTNKGLDRYDGYNLKNYRLPNPNINGQYTNRILALHLSENGTLWVAPEALGVFFFDSASDSFKNLSEKAPNPKDKQVLNSLIARSINTSKNGEVLIGTSTQGLYVVGFDKNGQVNKIQRVGFPSIGENPLVFSICPDKKGKIWIGTVGSGLWFLDVKNGQYVAQQFPNWTNKIIRGITPSHNLGIWVASEDEIIKIEEKDGAYQIKSTHLEFNLITSLLEDSYKRLWVGSRTGLYMLSSIAESPSEITFSINHYTPNDNDPNALNYHLIHNLIEDGFNNLWIAASAGGLNKVSLLPKTFFHLDKRTGGLPNDYTNTVCQDKNNPILWIGTRNGFSSYHLITRKTTNFLSEKSLKNAPNVDVTSIYDAGNGTLWISTRVHGVYIFNKANQSLQKLPEIPGQKLWKYAEPIAIAEDKYGQIWVACFYDGLHIFDKTGKHKTSFSKAAGTLLSAKPTYLLYEPENDLMWLSTRDSGILKLKLNNSALKLIKTFSFNPKGLKTNYIWPLTKSKNGDIWVGTIGGGLHRIKKGTEQVESYLAWLPETDVESILEDNLGNLWIGGSGLYKFNPKTKKYLHFDVADGLQSNSFKVGSASKDHTGKLYFGGINGLTYFDPKNVFTNPHPPKMQITQVRFLNYELNQDNPKAIVSGPFDPGKQIIIKDFENDFTIEFVGLNYINPGKQHYEYKLQGFHKNWIVLPQGQRMMGFSNLPSGSYTFLVKSDNGDGLWAEKPASLKFKILPPWYKTWWAYSFYALVAMAAIYWYKTTSRKQRELKNKIAIEQVEKEKEKELADMKLNFFTNVSHELRTPLTLIMSPAEDLMQEAGASNQARQKAELVHKQANKLLTLVNQLMDFRKVESGNMTLQLQTTDIIPFLSEILTMYKVKAIEQGIGYTVHLPKENVLMSFDPEKLEIVLSNLISNAFKYTPPQGQIDVSVKISGSPLQEPKFQDGKLKTNYLSIKVKDTGLGIHEDEIKHVFEPFYQAIKTKKPKSPGTGIGLSIVLDLVKKHKGEIELISKVNKGSLFTVKLPFEPNTIPSYPLGGEEPLAEVSPSAENIPELKGSKVLVVEDNDELRKYIKDLFKPHFETHVAANGQEGWLQILKLSPDLVLSDVMMPELNGLELCTKLKNNPKTAHIPIILLTAMAATMHELEGLETGADDYIVKPFNPTVLISKVQGVLTNRKRAIEYYQKQLLTEPTEITIPDTDRQFLENIMKTVEANLTNEQFGVQTLVRETGMSQSAFYRKLKNLTGQSVIELIKDIRLKRAAQLLSSGQYRVSEVAMMVGMEDLKNFRNSFQKLYGVPPSEYAKT